MPSSPVLRRLAVGAGVLVLTAGMAGCSAAAPEPTGALAIVVGTHSNMPAAELSGVADDVLETAVVAESHLSVVVADGEPFEAATGRLLASDENSTARDQDREANRQLVRAELTGAAARTPEVDLLGALDLAARSIASTPGRHTLLAVDSGLSTVAPLDFTQPGLLDADPAELAASLHAAGQLPDLSGVDLVFQGLGDTAEPQPALGRAQRTNLIAIWTAIARAAGAGDVRVEEAPLSGPAGEGLPPVSIVPPGSSVQCTPGRVVLAGGDVAFRADSADFVDEAVAAETLRPIAAQLAAGGLTATVTGTTARVGEAAGQVRLSRERAQAVADTLASLGVPTGSMTVVGLGSQFPEYVVDSDAGGNLVPGAAAANRKVVIDLPGAPAGVSCARG